MKNISELIKTKQDRISMQFKIDRKLKAELKKELQKLNISLDEFFEPIIRQFIKERQSK